MAKEMRTGIIRFNLKDRMRTYTGENRTFNIKSLVQAINSPVTQEAVKHGDLNGYYGHFPRLKWGARPLESNIVDGKMIYLEPCCRTIKLTAYDDGSVEHEQEFFNTELGRKAWARLQDKSGGFSSVITNTYGKYQFHGFDYVDKPNYSSNRPYALTLDGVGGVEVIDEYMFILDDVGDRNKAQVQILLDEVTNYYEQSQNLNAQNLVLMDSVEHLKAENQLLIDEIVTLKAKKTPPTVASRGSMTNGLILDSAIAKANVFKTMTLDFSDEQESERWGSIKNQTDAILRL